MSIPEYFEADDLPGDESLREQAERDQFELLDTLHRLRDALTASEEQGADPLLTLGPTLLGTINVPAKFIEKDSNELIMPGDILFDELMWEPKRHAPAAFSVEAIFVRHPRLASKKYGVHDPNHIVIPNDIFVEIINKSGDSERYLLNSGGINGYSDGEAIDFHENEMHQPTGSEPRRPNVFTVMGDHWYVQPMDGTALKRLLLEESAISPHPKSAAE